MSTIQVKILNPKVSKLLQDLADLELISITPSPTLHFNEILEKIRSKRKTAPSIEEITNEVELVRSKRNEK